MAKCFVEQPKGQKDKLLQSHPQHGLVKLHMVGFGGVVSFEIEGYSEKIARFVDNPKMCNIASVGWVEKIIRQPITSFHCNSTPEKRI